MHAACRPLEPVVLRGEHSCLHLHRHHRHLGCLRRGCGGVGGYAGGGYTGGGQGGGAGGFRRGGGGRARGEEVTRGHLKVGIWVGPGLSSQGGSGAGSEGSEASGKGT